MIEETEVTIRYAKGGLPDLAAAWAFVMEHVDRVGQAPRIEISPVWSISASEPGSTENYCWTFSAVVSGMVEEESW